MNERHEQSVADQNVERLLENAYEPELPDAEFVQRVGQRVLAESTRDNDSGDQVERPARRAMRRLMHWETVPWAIAALLLIIVIYLSIPKSSDTPTVYQDDDIIWINGKPYVAAPSDDPQTGSGLKPIKESRSPVAPTVRPVKLVGNTGLTARERPNTEPPAAIEIGSTITTTGGERRLVSLPDGSSMFVNENSTVEINERRTIRLASGQVFLEVAPDAENKFVVKTADRDITALGTKFAVQVADAKTAVVVTQGKVKVDGVENPVQAGQQLAAKNKSSDDPVVSTASRASHLLSWTKDLMAAAESPLVPGSDHAGGSLVVVDSSGQNAELSLRKYHVDVHIQDGFARTTIDQTYFNHLTSRLEGTFYFPLPPDASISRLAMYVGGKLMEGGMCERDRARDVFETIKHRSLDPALLEWVDGSTFKMRVFPLEGREEKRIVLSYTQRLENHYGRLQYRFPAGHNMQSVRDWSVNVRLTDAEQYEWKCTSHDLTSNTQDGDLLLTASAKDIKLDRDVVIELNEKEASAGRARFATVEHESQYFMIRYRPTFETKAQRERRDWIFLFDADGSRDPLVARVQIDIIKTLLDNAEHDDTFAIVTAGTRTHAFAPEMKPATPQNITAAIEFLNGTHLIGALDLEKALNACSAYSQTAENPALVHVGAGVPILGQRETDILLKKLPHKTRYVGVGVGKRWNRSFMQAAASKTGGYFTQINPDEPVAWRAFELSATLNTPRLLDLRVEADADTCELLSFGDSAVHGEQICAVAKLKPGESLPKSIRIRGKLDGQNLSETISVESVEKGAGYLPRFWAKLAIDDMVAESASIHKAEIVELSKSMYVMSPFTSLLVLENDEMYEQYKVDRGRKDHWALYPCPDKIDVVREPLHGPKLDVVSDDTKDSKPSPREIMESLLVRLPRFQFATASTTFVHRAPIRAIGGNNTKPHSSIDPTSDMIVFANAFPVGDLVVPVSHRGFVSNGNGEFDDVSDFTVFGLDPDGHPTGSLELEFIQPNFQSGIPRYGVFDANGRYIRRANFDIAGEIPSFEEAQAYLGGGFGWRNAAMADFDSLIDLIQTTVAPDSWDAVGGPGAIDAFEGNLSLVISQTQHVHEQFGLPRAWNDRRYDHAFGTTVQLPAFAEALRLVESANIQYPDDLWLVYPDADTWEELMTTKRLKYRSVDLNKRTSQQIRDMRRITVALDESTKLEFVEKPLKDVIEYLEDRHEIQIKLDTSALDDVGIGTDTPITRDLDGITLRSALRLMLRDLELSYMIDDGVLLITTPDLVASNSPTWQSYEELLLEMPTESKFDHERAWSAMSEWLNDRRLLGAWAKQLTLRLENDLQAPNLLYFQPAIANDQKPFRHLLAYAPGMNTTRADMLAVLEKEAEIADARQAGKIDERARALVEAARKLNWQSITIDGEGRRPLHVQIDGRGRYRFERRTEYGLLEQVVCDGTTIWHLYPELGVGAKRPSSRFHRASLTSLVPWHVRSAEDMASGADLRMIGERTVAIVPHWASQPPLPLGEGRGEGTSPTASTPHPTSPLEGRGAEPQRYVRVHLVFGENGRLAERQLVEMPTGKIIARSTFANDGTVRVFNREDKPQGEVKLAVKDIAAPDLNPDIKDLVVLPMPVRDRSHVFEQVKAAGTSGDTSGDALEQIVDKDRPSDDVARWSDEDALQLIAANHWQSLDGLRDVIARRFFARGDRRIGFYTLLLSSGWRWDVDEAATLSDGTKVDMNPVADHPKDPLAQYIAGQLKLERYDSQQLPAAIKTDQNNFIAQLSEYRYLHARWRDDQTMSDDAELLRRDTERLFDFVERCESPTFGFTLLRRVQHHLGAKQPFGRIADALLRFEKQGVTSYVVQYELARQLAANGKQDQARSLFLQLYRDTFNRGILPPIDSTFAKVVKELRRDSAATDDPFDGSLFAGESFSEYGGNFEKLIKETCERLIDQHQRPTAVALAWQCRELGQTNLAQQLIEKLLTALTDDERISTTKAVIEYLLHSNESTRAGNLVASMLTDVESAKQPALWRLAAKIAQDADMLAQSLEYRQRAVELEFAEFDSAVNLDWVRNAYGELLGEYAKLANVTARPGSDATDELLTAVIKTADQWRSLDTDPTAACNAAAKILNQLGEEALAWDYLTTPLALKPNESAPWLDLAKTLRVEQQFDLADRAFAAAFEAESTNAEILWQHAQMLDESGKASRALQLYDQLAGGEWQPRFQWIKTQAQRILDRAREPKGGKS